MKFVADLHIHSHYSRATSRDCNPENLHQWAVYKGITVLGTGDFTHPAWREELRTKLEPAEEGLYRLREEFHQFDPIQPPPGSSPVRFVVSGEISTIYKKAGRVRKVHHLLVLPSLEAADELSRRLEGIGNIRSDGRPILGLDSHHLLEMALEVCPEVLFIPAHIWTPHFSLFGANSGFDTMEECFEDLKDYIYAVETGLSSDPPMNWRLSALDGLALISNSDAHSPRNLSREANLFDTELSYPSIRAALRERDASRFLGTLEFFPEEGKYHYDGHRNCKVCWEPSQTRTAAGVCSLCGRKVTVGVLHRVEELADRAEGIRPEAARPFESLVPLPEVISSAVGVGPQSKTVQRYYFSMLAQLGPELVILRDTPLEQIAEVGGTLVAEAIRRMRTGEVEAHPGFDGEYGKIVLLRPEEREQLLGQAVLFEETLSKAAVKPKQKRTKNQSIPVLPEHQAASKEMSHTGGGPHWAPLGVHMVHPGTGEDISHLGLIEVSEEAPDVTAVSEEILNPVEILAGLNPEQREAVTTEEGPVIVIAGPGTGKTRTLVHRIAYLIGERGVSPHHLTAVTFTNKAAQEIRHRLMELLGDAKVVQSITIGTFHSICLDLLRNQRNQRGLGGNRLIVLDAIDSQSLLQEVWPESNKKRSKGLLKLHREISFLKSCGHTFSSSEVSEELRPLYRAYQEWLTEYGALDYDDILLEAVNLCESWRKTSDSTAAEPEELTRFTHLLVDEFQDVNPVQYRLVKSWAGKGTSTFVIGDPDQAIYGFRGADYRFFWQLKADFPEARFCQLSLNYRSTPTILRAASEVVANNAHNSENWLLADRDRESISTVKGASTPESLNSKVDQEPTPALKMALKLRPVRKYDCKIQHWEVSSEMAEGIAIVQEINHLVGGTTMLQSHGQGGGLPVGGREAKEEEARGFSDIAVLFRTGRQGEQLEECFLKEGIPYRMVGRESFLAEREVREVLAFFRCLVDPEDNFHLFRCLSAKVFGPGQGGISLVREKARQIGGSAWTAMVELTEGQLSPRPAAIKKLAVLRNLLEKYRSLMESEPPGSLLSRWIEEHQVKLKGPESLNRLLRVASRFNDLPSFIAQLVLGQEVDQERPGSNVLTSEAVTLMTLHAAKGLEFPVVFMTGVENGLLPLKERQAPEKADKAGQNKEEQVKEGQEQEEQGEVKQDEVKQVKEEQNQNQNGRAKERLALTLTEEGLAEERRLFYVGLTRAKDQLILVTAKHRALLGRKASTQPSPFLLEIPPDCLEHKTWGDQTRRKRSDRENIKQLSLF